MERRLRHPGVPFTLSQGLPDTPPALSHEQMLSAVEDGLRLANQAALYGLSLKAAQARSARSRTEPR